MACGCVVTGYAHAGHVFFRCSVPVFPGIWAGPTGGLVSSLVFAGGVCYAGRVLSESFPTSWALLVVSIPACLGLPAAGLWFSGPILRPIWIYLHLACALCSALSFERCPICLERSPVPVPGCPSYGVDTQVALCPAGVFPRPVTLG